MNLWWQNRNINLYNEIINHINLSKEEDNSIRKCEFLFKALNNLWTDYFKYSKATHKLPKEEESPVWSDNKAFSKLFISLAENKILQLCQSEATKSFVCFSPQIMNHDTLRKYDYDPDNISAEIQKKSSEEHKQLYNAYFRFVQNNYNNAFIEPLIKRLAQLLYIVRSNIMHGEKTPKGPDFNKVTRDSDVCKVVSPLLILILELFFENPSNRVACYGTLLPGEPNSKAIEKYDGFWSDGFVQGKIDTINGLLFFKWEARGNDIPVKIFESSSMSLNIDELDRFEGVYYKRIWIPCKLNNYFTICSIYERRDAF